MNNFVFLVKDTMKIAKSDRFLIGDYFGEINKGDILKDICGNEITVKGIGTPSSGRKDMIALQIQEDFIPEFFMDKYFFRSFETAFIFCKDYKYNFEYNAALENGLNCFALKQEDLLSLNEIKKAVTPTRMIYRGPALSLEEYEILYKALSDKNYYMINTPEQYAVARYLPEWYYYVQDVTPFSMWTESYNNEEMISKILEKFGNKPLSVCDYSNNFSEYRQIPDNKDINKSLETIRSFVSQKGSELNKGIVIRESLKAKGKIEIYRIFVFNKKIIAAFNFWQSESKSFEEWTELIELTNDIGINFYAADLAREDDGNWVILNISDAQIADILSSHSNIFYNSLSLYI